MVGSLLKGEKFRGFFTSVASATIAGGLNVLGTYMGLDPTLSVLVSVYLLGNAVAYVGDIMFAKEKFANLDGRSSSSPSERVIPYDAYMQRLTWLLKSFTDRYFYRFVITVVLDTLVGISIIRASIDFLDDHDVLTEFMWRDLFVTGLVSVFTFFLYTNVLRFDWAYRSDTDLTMDMVVLVGMIVVMTVFALTYRSRGDNKNKRKKSTAPDDDPRVSERERVVNEILRSDV